MVALSDINTRTLCKESLIQNLGRQQLFSTALKLYKMILEEYVASLQIFSLHGGILAENRN